MELFLTRRQAADYISQRYFPCAPATLASLSVKGNGPIFRKQGTLRVVYEPARLDEWALTRISSKEFRNSAEVGNTKVETRGRPRKTIAPVTEEAS